MNHETLKDLLRKNGMRATKQRLAVLAFVETQERPVGVEVLRKKFPNINEVTLYRMASDFVEKNIWNSYDLGHGHLDFESANRPHHHHVVCESCGNIEEVFSCGDECKMQTAIQKASKKFSTIKTPDASLFGMCHTCSA